MQYTFIVGQVVRARSRVSGRLGARWYRVVRLLPPPDDEVPRYRVRSIADGGEWVVAQDRIEPASASRNISPGGVGR
jgi:hypothetical protein